MQRLQPVGSESTLQTVARHDRDAHPESRVVTVSKRYFGIIKDKLLLLELQEVFYAALAVQMSKLPSFAYSSMSIAPTKEIQQASHRLLRVLHQILKSHIIDWCS